MVNYLRDSQPQIFTYRDLIDHLVDYLGATGPEAEENRIRRVVQDCYRDVCLEYEWRYLLTHGRINLDAQYSTGTVTVAAGSRQVTIAGGTWPDWVRYGRITFSGDNVVYKVSGVTSDASIIELEPTHTTQAAVAAGTSYQLWRSVYPLPGDLRSMLEMHDEQGQWSTYYVEPNEWLRLERQLNYGGRPWYWTLMGAGDLYGQLALHLGSRPTAVQSFDFLYQKLPGRLKYDGYEYYSSQGSNRITTADPNTSSVTFNMGIPNDALNSVVRIAMAGASGPPGSAGSANPYEDQVIVTARTSGTVAAISPVWTLGLGSSGGHFTWSSPVDLPVHCITLLKRACEAELARKLLPQRLDQAERSLAMARRKTRGLDKHTPTPQLPLGWQGWRHTSFPGTITQYWEGVQV